MTPTREQVEEAVRKLSDEIRQKGYAYADLDTADLWAVNEMVESGTYRWRLCGKAVLVEIKPDK